MAGAGAEVLAVIIDILTVKICFICTKYILQNIYTIENLNWVSLDQNVQVDIYTHFDTRKF